MTRQYVGGYWRSVLAYCEFPGHHMKKIKGCEYYGKLAENL